MSASPFADQIEQAVAALREQQAKMAETTRELQESTASVTSKDRMVTAVVGAQGQVVSLTFHTTAYRSMAPAQLSGLLTDVLNEARADMGAKVTESMRSFEGLGELLRTSMTGGTELDELLAPLQAMRPGHAEAEARRLRGRQEEFRG
ncbi:YbaB/EbfC family nucleoid-associated protein [Kitasatospora sp. NBC_01287]|uniref:YbaB/EbfC family nucleoid-associated protein n=1 Tax=Kitasatospora sp. NBC_01287 TaxID=2903573 RepID=UPI0022566D6C|nr:YbaB/EbfC family nucleoid-associated protein [Kitasatospora sp. NBC_01287]MCX4745830.1 YbaB/EbfC family nucleoid-associated protein [Kitasatospora sp. NBC_01287]